MTARSRLALVATALVSVVLVVRPGMTKAETPGAWERCVFRGSMSPAYVADHERWLGQPVARALEMIPYGSWAAIEQPRKQIQAWQDTPYRPIFTTPLLPRDGVSTLAAGASGAYDERWRTFARTFVAEGASDAIIRLGHEFNHTHYPWTAADGDEASFAAYYRRVVTVLRSVPGTQFTFVWNVLSNSPAADAERAYPGDAYVDIISLDLYDGSRGIDDFEQRWQRTLTQPYGLDWLRQFAAAHRKPMAFDEWGLIKSIDHDKRDPSGDSGDDTVFIQRMLDFFDDENVAYACYFDWRTNAGSSDSRIMNGPYPDASRGYRTRLGGSPAPLVPTSTTSTTSTILPPAGTVEETIEELRSASTSTPTTAGGGEPSTVSVVVGNAASLPSKDVPLRQRLEHLGRTVRLVDDDALSPASLDGSSLVVVSSSVVPSKVPAWLGDQPVPILSAEAYAQVTLRLATATTERAGHTTVRITDEAHPLAAGRRGAVAAQSSVPMGMGTPASGADVIAASSTGESAVYALERGSALTTGTAPARRVALFFSYDSPPALTADGWALFDAAVHWLS